MISFKISVRLEEPLKMKTKVKVDTDLATPDLPFESLIVGAKPFDSNGKYFEIKLNTPPAETGEKPQPNRKDSGLIQWFRQKIHPPRPKQKPSPNHIILTELKPGQSNTNPQGGTDDEKSAEPTTGISPENS